MYCPMVNDQCKKEECAWYISNEIMNCCVLVGIWWELSDINESTREMVSDDVN